MPSGPKKETISLDPPAETISPSQIVDLARGPYRETQPPPSPAPAAAGDVAKPVVITPAAATAPAAQDPMVQPVMAPRVMVPARQGRDQKTPPAGDAIVAQILAGNLGSAPEFLAAQKIDERKFAFLNDLTATALGYFGYRGYKDKVGFWAWCVDWELTSSVGINGMGRRHILAALLNARGGNMPEVVGRPNILSRNLWNRGWKEDAWRKGQVTTEDQQGE